MDLLIQEGKILFPKNPEGRPREKKFLQELEKNVTGFSTWLDSTIVGFTTHGTREVTALMKDKLFDFPKPIQLIQTFIKQIIEDEDIIFDFFAGSGTTAHAIMELNKADGGRRKYICVQLPEATDEKSEAWKAGYRTIADIAKERIRRVGGRLQKEMEAEAVKKQGQFDFEPEAKAKKADVGFKVFKLADSNFKQWQQISGKDAAALEAQMKLFVDPVAENATVENMVYELLLKSGKDLNSKIEKTQGCFVVNENEIVFMLGEATQEIVEAVINIKPLKVVALDKLFMGNDQLKTNTVLQMKDAGIEFKTI